MRAIIIEDEEPAAKALEALIKKLYPEIEIVNTIQSAEDSVEWLSINPMPDLIFMDIHLSDDLSFSIFDHIRITCPVIFITAYDKYALKAFEANGIDYLLKPVEEERLTRAVEKYKNLTKMPDGSHEAILNLIANFKSDTVKYRSHLLVSDKDKLIPLSVQDVSCLYIDAKMVYIVTRDKHRWRIEQTLEELMSQLDPTEFYRANRQYIIARSAIKNISVWFGGKLSVALTAPTTERIYISKARVKDFKDWLTYY